MFVKEFSNALSVIHEMSTVYICYLAFLYFNVTYMVKMKYRYESCSSVPKKY